MSAQQSVSAEKKRFASSFDAATWTTSFWSSTSFRVFSCTSERFKPAFCSNFLICRCSRSVPGCAAPPIRATPSGQILRQSSRKSSSALKQADPHGAQHGYIIVELHSAMCVCVCVRVYSYRFLYVSTRRGPLLDSVSSEAGDAASVIERRS